MGIECVPVLKGMGECDVIANLWLDHLDTAVKALDKACKHAK